MLNFLSVSTKFCTFGACGTSNFCTYMLCLGAPLTQNPPTVSGLRVEHSGSRLVTQACLQTRSTTTVFETSFCRVLTSLYHWTLLCELAETPMIIPSFNPTNLSQANSWVDNLPAPPLCWCFQWVKPNFFRQGSGGNWVQKTPTIFSPLGPKKGDDKVTDEKIWWCQLFWALFI